MTCMTQLIVGDPLKLLPVFVPLLFRFSFTHLFILVAVLFLPRCPPPRNPVPAELALALLCPPSTPACHAACLRTRRASPPKRSRLRAWTAARRTSYPHPRIAKPCGSASDCLLTMRAATGHDVAYGSHIAT